ncbi:hypothetical protein PUN28_007694 [Cardiocondyla obscurior]|uniref:Regulatory protein zeste n=1 Tax=Cardiocondyla obscurior TaxID=286306 RepID=A0AAW2FTP0_9HYME
MASAFLKGTRKTYSFEERKILISLINKHEVLQNRKSDPISIYKRKSAWSRIAEEYNLIVGSQSTRSAVQLRRCWDNMKACKRNREEKKFRDDTKPVSQSVKNDRVKNQCWEGICGQNMPEAPMSTGTIGLPPNVVFEPKESEPFTLQSLCTARTQNSNCLKKDVDTPEYSNSDEELEWKMGSEKRDKIAASFYSINDYCKKFMKGNSDSLAIDQPADNSLEKVVRQAIHANPESSDMHPSISPCVLQDNNRNEKSMQQEQELHVLALSEAQMRVDIAAMLKEEARIKLEEARYRKEEARLKMLFFTYKLDRLKDG